ncbi:MAG: alpha,alpha-trehalase TreF [Spirosoma sp.]|nr:alpha,alpha-trehalase TreF [Spirosoma sp.]
MNPLTKPLLFALLVFANAFAANAQQITVRPTVAQKWADPAEQFGRFFADVQLKAVFPDSKTFADCTPKASVQTIVTAYEVARTQPGFDLKAFVLQYFTLPVTPASGYVSKTGQLAQEHINELWPVLTRPAEKEGQPIGSRIPLPKAYVVPGGRFSEIYYWDSYFTMLGLQKSGKTDLIQNMADNFAYLVDTFGFIPNGSRTYYLGRSQPPFFSFIINLLSETNGRRTLVKYLPQLQKEYDFWMDGKANLTAQNPAFRRVVRLSDGTILNRYYDDRTTPRPESYKEDALLAQKVAKTQAETEQLYRNLRAGAESGWDYSSRWFRDGKTLATIHTTDFVPVDLNCLLTNLERTLSEGYRLKGDTKRSDQYLALSRQRRDAVQKYCWDGPRNFFFDYDFVAKKSSAVYSLAGVVPLFMRMSTAQQAVGVARTLERQFLKPGGLITTVNTTGEQWDAPNGWAPLQWMAIRGLRNYRQPKLADLIKTRWVNENLRVYKATGKMVEKYDVVNTAAAKGGEYPNQDGFGWTNGVLLRLLSEK